jgi:fatty acid desaturase
LRSRGGLRELWRISGFVYREVAYQLVYMQRSGSRLPQAEEASNLAKGATSYMLMNKVLAAGILSAMGVFAAFLGVLEWGGAAFGFAAFLATLLAYTLFFFLQPMTSFVSPVSARDHAKETYEHAGKGGREAGDPPARSGRLPRKVVSRAVEG